MPWYGNDDSQYRISMASRCHRGPIPTAFAPFVPQINGTNYPKKEGTKRFLDAVVDSDNHDGYNSGDDKEARNPNEDYINHDGYRNRYGGDYGYREWRNLIDGPVKKGPSPSPSPSASDSPVYINSGYGGYGVGNGNDEAFLRNKAASRGYNGGYKSHEDEYVDNMVHERRQDGPGPLWRRPVQPYEKKGMDEVQESERPVTVRGAPHNQYGASMPVINTYVHMSGITF